MSERRTYFLTGLFVFVGIAICVAGIVWLGATKYFQKGTLRATYFDESVQGLQVDSIVKYRGVDVGTVKVIRVAPDHRLVEVIMKIDETGLPTSGVVAKLTMAGITGIVYVELDRQQAGQPGLVPNDFRADYPVIPSSPSSIKNIETSVNDILASIKQIDFKGISDQVMKTGRAADALLSGEKLNKIIDNLGTASTNLASASAKINSLAADGSIKDAITGARDAVSEARAVIELARTELSSSGIGRTGAKIDRFVEGTSRRVQSILTEVQDTTERVRKAADSLETLAERLNADPSLLLFSNPPKGE